MEEERKNSIVIYCDWLPAIRKIPREDAGNLFIALLEYALTGEEPDFSGNLALDVLFTQYSILVSRDIEKYGETKKRRKAAAEERERKKREEAQNTTKSTIVQNCAETATKSTTSTVNVNDNVNVNGNVNDNVNVNGNVNDNVNVNGNVNVNNNINNNTTTSIRAREVKPIQELTQEQIGEICDLWNANQITKNIQNINRMSSRENNTRLCIGLCGLNEFLKVIKTIDSQAFFRRLFEEEQNPLTYDWFVKPDNFQKVIEGNYKEERKRKSRAEPKKTALEEWEEA